MSQRSDDQGGSNRLFCDAWNGSRSPGFLKFKRDFKTGADATFLHEDDDSLWAAMDDMDAGGQKQGTEYQPIHDRVQVRAITC